jgi:hypothetical protein
VERRQRERPREQEPLTQRAAEQAQDVALLGCLDPLGTSRRSRLCAKPMIPRTMAGSPTRSRMKGRAIFSPLTGRRRRWLSDE